MEPCTSSPSPDPPIWPRPPELADMCLGLPARVIAIEQDRPGLAWVDVGTVPREIDLGLLGDDPPCVGDWVVIHLGYALERLTEAEALETIGLLHDPTVYEAPSAPAPVPG